MNRQQFTMMCSIAPPCVIYIGETSPQNEFTIHFKKVPITPPEVILGRRLQKEPKDNENDADGKDVDGKPKIYLECTFGSDVGDLWTKEQAGNTKFTNLTGDGWRMEWSDINSCFIISPPQGFDFSREYTVSFRSGGFFTSAKEGTAILSGYLVNFSDVPEQVVNAELHKRYPVKLEYFNIAPESLELGAKATLSWKALGADRCRISRLGEVDVEGSREVLVSRPELFVLTAENDMGRSVTIEKQAKLLKPQVTFAADRLYYYPGEKIHLSWKAVSASGVTILPMPGQMEKEGAADTVPEGDTTYSIAAHGYDGTTIYDAVKSIIVRATRWKAEGTVTGFSPEEKSAGNAPAILPYGGKLYLFEKDTLWESADGLAWSSVSKLTCSGNVKMEGYTTSVFNDTFFVAGVTKTESSGVWMFCYNLGKKEWNSCEMMSYIHNAGGILAVVRDRHLYAKLKGSKVMIFEKNPRMTRWGNVLFLDGKEELDAVDFIGNNGRMMLAVRSKASHIITAYSAWFGDKEWTCLGTLEKKTDGWFRLVTVRGGKAYILTADAMYDIGEFKQASGFHPPFDSEIGPWCGAADGNPIFILKNKGIWKWK